jgi:hypothetical protein
MLVVGGSNKSDALDELYRGAEARAHGAIPSPSPRDRIRA